MYFKSYSLIKKIFYLVLGLSSPFTFSQNTLQTNNTGQIYFRDLKDLSNEISYNNVEGSPYVDNEYQLIKFKKFKNEVYQGRYNAYNDSFEVKFKGKIIQLNNLDHYEITLVNKNKKYKNIFNNDSTSSKFYVILKESKNFSLYKKEQIKFKEAKKPSSSYDTAKPAKFYRLKDTYFIYINKNLLEVPSKKKKIITLFPKYSKEIKEYFKKNNFNLKNENDLIKLVEYLNNLDI